MFLPTSCFATRGSFDYDKDSLRWKMMSGWMMMHSVGSVQIVRYSSVDDAHCYNGGGFGGVGGLITFVVDCKQHDVLPWTMRVVTRGVQGVGG